MTLGNAGLRFIDHVGVVVKDLDSAIDLFTATYGLSKELVEEVPSVGVRLAFLRTAESGQRTTLQLVEPIAPGPVMEFLSSHGEGLHHVCFGVDQIQPLLTQLPDERGVDVFTGGRGRLACFLSQRPSGTLIEFTQIGTGVP